VMDRPYAFAECDEYRGDCLLCEVSGVICPRAVEEAWERVGVGRRYWGSTLEGIPSENCRNAVARYCEDIATQVSIGRGLILAGGVGSGKTSILAVIARAAAQARPRLDALFFYAPALFDALHKDDREAVGRARSCALLLLDDFTTQYATDWTISRFDALSEHRYSRQLATCVSSNLTLRELGKVETWARAVDRWRETCLALETGNKSLRGRAKEAAHGDGG
jgi:DNA replication protein DnaC